MPTNAAAQALIGEECKVKFDRWVADPPFIIKCPPAESLSDARRHSTRVKSENQFSLSEYSTPRCSLTYHSHAQVGNCFCSSGRTTDFSRLFPTFPDFSRLFPTFPDLARVRAFPKCAEVRKHSAETVCFRTSAGGWSESSLCPSE
jgi:hypothetical protein